MTTNNAYAYSDSKTIDKGDRNAAIHTTLPMEDLIGLFESEIRGIIRYDSFEYENPRNSTHVFQGIQRLHKCHYKINVSKQDLGQITLSRRTPFDEVEINLIEKALGALIIHLTNAMDYQCGLDEKSMNTLLADQAYASLK